MTTHILDKELSMMVGRMMTAVIFSTLSSLTFWTPVRAGEGTKAIRFGKLVDGSGRVVKDAVVVVEGDRVTKVGSGDADVPKGAEVIDLSRYTGIPGLIDVHTHMTYYWDQAPGTKPWEQAGDRNAAVTVFLAQENARKTLETGVTTVRDLGSSDYADVAMRDLIDRGAMRGPRMFVAGEGLHVGRFPKQAAGEKADRIPEVLRAVRQQVEAKADVIKMYGSTGSADDLTGAQTFTFDEMKAAVDAAHKASKRIAIHSYGPDGARDAVRAGADSVEHATDMDDATIADMVKRKTIYVPTIDHNRYYADHRKEYGYGKDVVDNLDAYRRRNLETARRAHKAGVRIAMGSDAVFTMFGQNTRELLQLVEAGMTPAEALAAATTNGAVLLGKEKSLGTVAPGFLADIVAVEGDPLADVHVIVDGVRWVMKGGEVVVDRRADRAKRQ